VIYDNKAAKQYGKQQGYTSNKEKQEKSAAIAA
jgi:hypothetical protein